MNVINRLMRGDKVIWIVTLLLAIVSLIVVYSSASALVFNKYHGSTSQMLIKHASTLFIGFVMLYIAYRIDYRHFAKVAWLLLIPCMALLLYTLTDRLHASTDIDWHLSEEEKDELRLEWTRRTLTRIRQYERKFAALHPEFEH